MSPSALNFLADLTPAQVEFAHKNIRLAGRFIESGGMGMVAAYADREDAYTFAVYGLYRAAMLYDKARRCRFSTYAWRCMMNMVKKGCRQNRRVTTRDFTTKGGGLSYRDRTLDNVEDRDSVAAVFKQLRGREREVFGLLGTLNGAEIGREIGLTKERVRQIINEVRQRVGYQPVKRRGR